MFVLRLEYWAGGDPERRRSEGWAAATRAFRRGRHEWHVVIALHGQRRSWSVPANGEDAFAAVLACAAKLGIAPGPHKPVPTEQADRATTRAVTAAVEAHLAGAQPCPGSPPGAGIPAPGRAVLQRVGHRDRVLALPHLTEQQMRDLFDGQRDHPAIVRGLRKAGALIGITHEGNRIFPAFQVRGGWLDPVVTAVNVTLRVNRNPWAGAIWWSTQHEVLGAVPVDLLHDPDDRDRLLGLAAADRL